MVGLGQSSKPIDDGTALPRREERRRRRYLRRGHRDHPDVFGRPKRRIRVWPVLPLGCARYLLVPAVTLGLLFLMPIWFAYAGGVPSGRPTITPVANGSSVNWDLATCAELPASEHRVCEFGPLFNAAGAEHGVDPRFLAAIAYVESGFREEIINCSLPSPAGALGLMQFLPGTARERGVSPCDTSSAIYGAAKYLAEAHKEFGAWELAAAAYNAGFQAVRDARGVPRNPETTKYVPAVMAKFEQYKQLFRAKFGACPLAAAGPTTPLNEAHVTAATGTMADAVVGCFGKSHNVGCWEWRDDPSGPGGKYEHPRGRACDFMLTNGGEAGGLDKVRGQAIAEWLAANAQELHILYVIWFNKSWNITDGFKPWEEWRTYDPNCVNGGCDDSHSHRNHVHVSIRFMAGDPSWAHCVPGIKCTENYRGY